MTASTATNSSSVKKLPILTITILGAFFTIFNQTTMTVALPTLMDAFGVLPATGQWLTTGYMLVNGIFIPITGYLMRRFTTRELFLGSMSVFLIGTIVAAAAPSFAVLLAGRLIQAASTGITMPLLMNVVLSLFPPEKRGTAMGTVGLAVIFAPAIGPALVGYVLDIFPWQALFYGMIPIIAVIIVCSFFFLETVTKTSKTKLDTTSLMLSTIGFSALLYGCSVAGNHGWTNQTVIVSLVAGGVAIGLFVRRQLLAGDPFLDLGAFKYTMFSLTTVINCTVTVLMYADMILLPLYLQNARGFTAMESGVLMLPGALLMGLLNPAVGKLFDRFGAKWLSVTGISIVLATTYTFTDLSASTSYSVLVLMFAGRRIGMALFLMPIQTAGLNQLPQALHAHGTAISNTAKQVAAAIGTAWLITIMTARTEDHLDILAQSGDLTEAQLATEAAIQGINDAYFAMLIFGVISLALSFFIKRVPAADYTEEKDKRAASA